MLALVLGLNLPGEGWAGEKVAQQIQGKSCSRTSWPCILTRIFFGVHPGLPPWRYDLSQRRGGCHTQNQFLKMSAKCPIFLKQSWFLLTRELWETISNFAKWGRLEENLFPSVLISSTRKTSPLGLEKCGKLLTSSSFFLLSIYCSHIFTI